MTQPSKTTDSVVIALNGPNLLSDRSRRLCSEFDVISFSSGALIDHLRPRFFFHEPWESLPTAYHNNIQYDLYQCMFLSFEVPIIEALIEHSKQSELYVIQGQQPFQKYFLTCPKDLQISIPKWYFCDETTFISGHRASIAYIQGRLWTTGCLLNYRCSLIRAFTLALALDYRQIFITGLNPSTPHYWFSADPAVGSKYLLTSLDRGLYRQVFLNSHLLINAIGNPGFDAQAFSSKTPDVEKEKKTITNIFFAFLSSCFAKCPIDFDEEKIRIISDDAYVMNCATRYHLTHLLDPSDCI